jgi:hypothetical protein
MSPLPPCSSAQLLLLEALKDEAYFPPHLLVIDHGVAFEPAALPSDVAAGEPNCCFYNAFTLASRHPDRYTYFEGFATYDPEASTWPVTHAWCVEGARVVDPTWVSKTICPLAYRGIALPMDLVEAYALKHSSALRAHAQKIDLVYSALGLRLPCG